MCLPTSVKEVCVEKVAEQPTVSRGCLSRSQATIVACVGEDHRKVEALVDTGGLRRFNIEGRAERSAPIPVVSSILADNGSMVSSFANVSGVRKKRVDYVPNVVKNTTKGVG